MYIDRGFKYVVTTSSKISVHKTKKLIYDSQLEEVQTRYQGRVKLLTKGALPVGEKGTYPGG